MTEYNCEVRYVVLHAHKYPARTNIDHYSIVMKSVISNEGIRIEEGCIPAKCIPDLTQVLSISLITSPYQKDVVVVDIDIIT